MTNTNEIRKYANAAIVNRVPLMYEWPSKEAHDLQIKQCLEFVRKQRDSFNGKYSFKEIISNLINHYMDYKDEFINGGQEDVLSLNVLMLHEIYVYELYKKRY